MDDVGSASFSEIDVVEFLVMLMFEHSIPVLNLNRSDPPSQFIFLFKQLVYDLLVHELLVSLSFLFTLLKLRL